MEPGVEPVRVAQAREVAPGSDVCLLDRVSRELLVPEDEAGDSLQPRDGRADEHGEGVMIAPPCPLDEFPLVHGHPRDAPTRSRSRVMASASVKPFRRGSASGAGGRGGGVAPGVASRIESMTDWSSRRSAAVAWEVHRASITTRPRPTPRIQSRSCSSVPKDTPYRILFENPTSPGKGSSGFLEPMQTTEFGELKVIGEWTCRA